MKRGGVDGQGVASGAGDDGGGGKRNDDVAASSDAAEGSKTLRVDRMRPRPLPWHHCHEQKRPIMSPLLP